jgi:alkylation response protein AidB-like acyl-CoA dehydrogenase
MPKESLTKYPISLIGYLVLSFFSSFSFVPLHSPFFCFSACEVHFDNTPVPIENVIGEVGGGFKVCLIIFPFYFYEENAL